MSVFPEQWQPVFQIFDQQNKEKIHGALSCFDGKPRPEGRLSDALSAAGIPCFSLDVRNHPKQDLTQSYGVQMFLDGLSRLQPRSLLWFAPPCSTYEWINRGTSGRTRELPEGRSSARMFDAEETRQFTARGLRAGSSRGHCAVEIRSLF